MIFPQFNCIVNPSNEKVYSVNSSKSRFNYEEVVVILKKEPNSVISWDVPKDFIVIKMHSSSKILPILINTGAKCLVWESKVDSYYYIVCRSAIKTKSNKCTIGLAAQYLRGLIRLPFKLKTCTLPDLLTTNIVYDKGVHDIEDILFPSEGKYSFVTPIMGDPTDVLILIMRNLPRWALEKKKNILKIINKYLCSAPRTDEELEAILVRAAETNIEDFFNGTEFMHDALGEYLIKLLHIKKDCNTGELYYYDSAKQIYDNNPEYIMGFITKNYSRLKQYQRKEVMDFITYYLYEDSIAMNTNPYSIVFNNGVLDVRTMKLTPMTPDKLESIKIEYTYSKYAFSETVDEFFNTLSCGDKEVETLFYESIGYGLLKTSELQTTFTLVGGGRNGKSTFLDILKKIAGKKYYTSIAYKDLANNFRASDLIGKLFSIAGDISSQPLNDSDLYKSIATGEDIMLEKKHKDAKSLALFCTLFFSCNKLPRTPDTTEGFYRRQTLIPCKANLEKISKVDGMLFKEKLMQTEAIEYIIYKAVQAIAEVFKRGDFTKPDCVNELLKEYKEDNSQVLSWIKEVYGTPGTVAKMTFKNAWKSYKAWVAESGKKQMSNTTFKNELKANGLDLED